MARVAQDAAVGSDVDGVARRQLLLGRAIVGFFNISIPGIRVAGGLIISTVGFRMLFPAPQ